MNKNKLRSLMFHAGFCNEDGGWDTRPIHEQEHDNFQRFAELIVRECADISYKIAWDDLVRSEPESVIPLHIYNSINEHFGVE